MGDSCMFVRLFVCSPFSVWRSKTVARRAWDLRIPAKLRNLIPKGPHSTFYVEGLTEKKDELIFLGPSLQLPGFAQNNAVNCPIVGDIIVLVAVKNNTTY